MYIFPANIFENCFIKLKWKLHYFLFKNPFLKTSGENLDLETSQNKSNLIIRKIMSAAKFENMYEITFGGLINIYFTEDGQNCRDTSRIMFFEANYCENFENHIQN